MAYMLLAKMYLNAESIGVSQYEEALAACDEIIALDAYMKLRIITLIIS